MTGLRLSPDHVGQRHPNILESFREDAGQRLLGKNLNLMFYRQRQNNWFKWYAAYAAYAAYGCLIIRFIFGFGLFEARPGGWGIAFRAKTTNHIYMKPS